MHRAADVAGSALPRVCLASFAQRRSISGERPALIAQGSDSGRRVGAAPHALLSSQRTCHVAGLIRAVANNERLLHVAERARKQARPRIRGVPAMVW